MKPYTDSNPVFSESIQITETTDPAHADNINAASKQLLQNTLVNQKSIEELEKGNQAVEFEDYSGEGTSVPDLEEAVSQVSSGKTDKVFRQYVKASLKGLLNLAQKALSVAMGKNQARVFATVEALDAWLAIPANVQQLNVGDNFYITALDVPDYWWDGNQKQKLETQKVDLTTYDQRISELYGNISSHTHDTRYYTEDEIDTKLSGKVGNNTTAVLASIELSHATPFIDFHFGKSSKDYTIRLIESSEGKLTFYGISFNVLGDLQMNGKSLQRKWKVKAISKKFTAINSQLTVSVAELQGATDCVVRIGIPTGGSAISTTPLHIENSMCQFITYHSDVWNFSGFVYRVGTVLYATVEKLKGWPITDISVIDVWYV